MNPHSPAPRRLPIDRLTLHGAASSCAPSHISQAVDALTGQLEALTSCIRAEQQARCAAEDELQAERMLRRQAEAQVADMLRELGEMQRLRAEEQAQHIA